MDVRLETLPWLETLPANDLATQVQLLSTTGAWRAAHRLAQYRLHGAALELLGRAITKLSAPDEGYFRLGVLCNATAAAFIPALNVSLVRHGLRAHVLGAAFNQVASEALNPHSEINRARCEYVLLSIDHRGLPFTPSPADFTKASRSVDSALSYIDNLRIQLRDASGCTVIVQTVPQVADPVFGNIERALPGTVQWLIDSYNRELRLRLPGSGDLLLDAAILAETVGLSHWHDPAQWALGKFPFSLSMAPIYADWIARLISAARGRSRKCLVLDLDNTLWGGVIGEDGVAGIVLGHGSAAGEAYLNVQTTALALRQRGVLLAVSSKNEEQTARTAFRHHPDMMLKEHHISIFQANWQDKASNLRTIAQKLNIGLDALVLLDDNAAERALIRRELPIVAVPELPADPALFAPILLAAGYFETTQFTLEDRSRAALYESNARRDEALASATDMESYLDSLEMRVSFGPFDQIGRARIAQLTNKTNQFNLTTRRYSEIDIGRFEERVSGLTLQVRLVDRFGDNGMISVVICKREADNWLIDTWLMSCRVFNRCVENATLNHMVACAHKVGVTTLIGIYVKTERNSLVSDHYAKLGFTSIYADSDESHWSLDVASFVPTPVPMQIISI